MPPKAALQALSRTPLTLGRKTTVFLPVITPPVAISVRTDRMFAIPVAINLRPFAVISRRCGSASCNDRAHGTPMFAIQAADVCRSLHLAFHFPDLVTVQDIILDRDFPSLPPGLEIATHQAGQVYFKVHTIVAVEHGPSELGLDLPAPRCQGNCANQGEAWAILAKVLCA